jgi:diguanylate cyclase (GGDEF)-like protein
MDIANRDALTSVKNKRAYVQTEVEMDEKIKKKEQSPFAVVVCDLNGLKHVNDVQGHQAGDEYIKGSCSIICNVFSHSPVFRIGGDEFAVILKDRDYENRYELVEQIGVEQESKRVNGMKPIAIGLSEFIPETDIRVQDVFERADNLMYADKKKCKSEV